MVIRGSTGDDTLAGSRGDDVLLGFAGRDYLRGLAGDDRLDGGAGDDDLRGGAGDDTYVIDHVGDITRSISDPGHDTVRASISYVLGPQQEDLVLTGGKALVGTGNGGANHLTGNAAGNLLTGGAGNDVLDGGRGDDDLRGGAGNDTYLVDDAGDINRFFADVGIDTVRARIGYVLGAQQENVQLLGAGNLDATGNARANTLTGNGGNNRLDGAAGADVLIGGAGDDSFVHDASDVSIAGGNGVDTLLAGAGVTALSLLTGPTLSGLEVVDLRGGADLHLTLDAAAIDAITGDLDLLRVRGGAGDVVAASGDWTLAATTVVEGVSYRDYAQGDVTLRVETAMGMDLAVGGVTLAALDGSNGFRLTFPPSGFALGPNLWPARDLDGDGLNDLLLQVAHNGGGNDVVALVRGSVEAGQPSVALPSAGDPLSPRFVNFDASFFIFDIRLVSLGDVDADGRGDLIFDVGSPFFGNTDARLIFGPQGGWPATIDVNTDGVGLHVRDSVGAEISFLSLNAGGDINGDGYADLLIAGSEAAIEPVRDLAYVVFGGPREALSDVVVGALDGQDGFRLESTEAAGQFIGLNASVAGIGDFNHDGFDDFASAVHVPAEQRGIASVVFGHAGNYAPAIARTDLDGTNGLRLFGAPLGHEVTVGGAGDVNGDGRDDLFVAVPSFPDVPAADSGVYVVFGNASGELNDIDLTTLDGADGFRVLGGDAGEFIGKLAAAAGDFNGDGYGDLLVGDADTGVGRVYVLYGHGGQFETELSLATLTAGSALVLRGILGENIGESGIGVGDVNGDGYDDVHLRDDGHGASYIVYGGNYNAAAQIVGGSGDDTLTGDGDANVLIGGRGDDTLNGGAGNDVLKGGAGDDVLVWDAQDRRLDGGHGSDTLRVTGSGVTLDLTLDGPRIGGIERIDLTGAGDNALTLGLRDVLRLPDGADLFLDHDTRQLVVDGDAGDSVTSLGQGWARGADVSIAGHDYASYTVAGTAAELLVDLAMTVMVA